MSWRDRAALESNSSEAGDEHPIDTSIEVRAPVRRDDGSIAIPPPTARGSWRERAVKEPPDAHADPAGFITHLSRGVASSVPFLPQINAAIGGTGRGPGAPGEHLGDYARDLFAGRPVSKIADRMVDDYRAQRDFNAQEDAARPKNAWDTAGNVASNVVQAAAMPAKGVAGLLASVGLGAASGLSNSSADLTRGEWAPALEDAGAGAGLGGALHGAGALAGKVAGTPGAAAGRQLAALGQGAEAAAPGIAKAAAAGTAIGGAMGGWGGAAIGGAAGKLVAGSRGALDWLSSALSTNPGRWGKYAAMLGRAKSPDEMATRHTVLMQADPEYRETYRKNQEDVEGP